jgi:hypothetical protein
VCRHSSGALLWKDGGFPRSRATTRRTEVIEAPAAPQVVQHPLGVKLAPRPTGDPDPARERMMIDPSIVVREQGVSWVESLDSAERLRFVIPSTFASGVRKGSTGWVADYYRLDRAFTRRLRAATEALTPWVPEAADRPSFVSQIAGELATLESNRDMSQVQVEEWLFLTSSSTLLSRLKAPFVQFRRAGATSPEMATRRTLHNLPAGVPLTPREYRRAGVKWIAVGGAPLVSLLGPWGYPAASLVGWLLLIDP